MLKICLEASICVENSAMFALEHLSSTSFHGIGYFPNDVKSALVGGFLYFIVLLTLSVFIEQMAVHGGVF